MSAAGNTTPSSAAISDEAPVLTSEATR
jgi:hypothetical protein